ncbi:hypothetical protein MJG53_005042 [Ovis ammon polii x Ovis aries]|uniref:Uncharacterized protein n=1 Tax=Ovis ammon polii x Ovis aries TaxID=2918886 RepID=A0ACB9VBU1_9CETA|nr:hypothetical protein MJT46_003075 [Ovis ammon polii x Ovis aries]KAI4587255.1 hypothetical protein MJG53_005042 [Ovis ammon polii x Ovis aries]
MTALQLKELSQSGLYRRRRDRPDSLRLPGPREEALSLHPGIELKPSAVKALSPNHWIPKNDSDSALPLPRALVPSLVEEQRSCRPPV